MSASPGGGNRGIETSGSESKTSRLQPVTKPVVEGCLSSSAAAGGGGTFGREADLLPSHLVTDLPQILECPLLPLLTDSSSDKISCFSSGVDCNIGVSWWNELVINCPLHDLAKSAKPPSPSAENAPLLRTSRHRVVFTQAS